MQTKTLNNDLIEAIKRSLPSGNGLTKKLMNILNIGKEAVYRRLRCEVPFTFAEASLLSKSLGISLDHISSACMGDQALFHLYIMNNEDPFDTYYRTSKDLLQNYTAIKHHPGAEWYTASNTIPHAFYMKYEYLAKFLLYKWVYQQNRIENVKYYADLEIPAKVREIQLAYAEETKALAYSCFIWDEIMFLSLVNDIRYFYDINLLTEKEKNQLKGELFSMMDTLEGWAERGEYENGKKVYFYISNINFEATYSYLSTDSIKLSFIRLYAINIISTTDRSIFEYQKNWIQSLKKYSTLISVSGEKQRIRFFEKQRSLIEKL
ncbi:MAG: hypothetical protein LBB84_05500 [Tannerellaceae bacterium]|jgi:hypothetical protein|nr:hypothetical protein [Tannerellaceae bacterium]